ncbi:MAG: hypothetical protein SVK08_08905, partial [Halobacteriota archaeon]|nr:hypothetical protein [Halobacteriota archaeon]
MRDSKLGSMFHGCGQSGINQDDPEGFEMSSLLYPHCVYLPILEVYPNLLRIYIWINFNPNPH